ncbi:hypothetical protein C0J52_10632 [Blattella germanica]|nr:hypothetical protein C0J52_10632 [Blattella germanica]
MFSTIFFHFVMENTIRPVKTILYSFNRGPPWQNRCSDPRLFIVIRHNWKKHKRHQNKKENCYVKLRQKPNRGYKLKPL